MGDDLVKRLLANDLEECDEAADRIEQLEGRLARAMGWKARCEDAEAALDRRIAEAKEEGFWIGRQTGGSKAEIDMALTAIRNRSNPND